MDTLADPYFIQRLRRRDNAHAKGFDAMFRLDYMGSSEFEGSAVRESLLHLRQAEVVTHPVTVLRPNGPVEFHLIGHVETLAQYAPLFTQWATAERPRAQESVRFDTLDAVDDQFATNAWWDLDAHVMFTHRAEIATDLIAAITPAKDA